MDKTEQVAFSNASLVAFSNAFYASNGNFSIKDIERFVHSLCGDGTEKSQDLYNLNSDLYSLILDAMDLWESARQFERGLK